MNKLYVGFTRNIELPKGGCLLIDDEIRDVARMRVFDPHAHSFNPLKDIEYKTAREISDVLYAIYPQGENTLTVRNGKRELLKGLLEGKRLDKVRGDEETEALIDDILISPVLRRVLCQPTNFSFNPNSVIMARLNRKELGEFDALVLGLFLMAHFKGQIIIPDLGFYGREKHASLVNDGRLIAGVNFLGELSSKLRNSVLLIEDKVVSGATVEDAEMLAHYAGMSRGTNEFNGFIERATGGNSVTVE